MKLSAISLFSLSALFATPGLAQFNAREAQMCAVCYGLAEKVETRMKETEHRADEQVSIGVRLGPDGKPVPKTVVNYGNSDKRLGDVLEGICIGSPDISKCNEIVHHYQDSLINTWFHEGRDKSFKDYVCGSAYQGCNADLVSQHLKHVEEEDAKEKEKQAEEDRRRAQEQADKKEQAERNAATSKSNTDSSQSRPKGATSSTSQQQQKKGDDKNGPTDLIMAFLNRIKNNMLRIKSLSGEMYEEVSTVVKAKDWNKLKVMLKDANFYRKYWNVLLWFFILTYTFISFVASLMAKPEPKRERRAGSTRRKAASSKASSTSSSTTAKDE